MDKWNWGNTLTLLGMIGIAGGTYTSVHSKNAEQDARIRTIEQAISLQSDDTKEILREVKEIGLHVNTLQANSNSVRDQIAEMKQDIKTIKRGAN